MAQLLQLAQSIGPQLRRNREFDEQVQNANNYSKRKDRLNVLVNRLLVMTNQVHLLQQQYAFSLIAPSLAHAKAETEKLHASFNEDTSTIIRVSDAIFEQWEKVVDELKKALELHWVTYKRDRVFQIDSSELELLESFKAYQGSLDRVKAEKANLDQFLSDKLPPIDEAQWHHLLQINLSLQQAWENLHWGNLPQTISNFIKKAKQEGVSLDDYTPEVRNWLEEHNLKQSFKIRLMPKANQ